MILSFLIKKALSSLMDVCAFLKLLCDFFVKIKTYLCISMFMVQYKTLYTFYTVQGEKQAMPRLDVEKGRGYTILIYPPPAFKNYEIRSCLHL